MVGGMMMFSEEELKNLMGLKKNGKEYVEIECGCTVLRLGDAFGNLRVYVDGTIKINCRCIPTCPKVNLSPIQFANHLGKSTSMEKWKKDLWVLNNEGKKIRLANTCLLRYHVQTFHRRLRYVHRDEFIRCKNCNKERRFRCTTKHECQIYHKASLHNNWKCSDTPELGKKCDDAEERPCRKPIRGCPRLPKCIGCEQCVCIGCQMCRFQDCNCQICVDHLQNEWHSNHHLD